MSSTPDNQPPGATDPAQQDDLTATLNSIMAQLTTISNRLDLQGTTLAKHAMLLNGAEGSVAAGGHSPAPNGDGSNPNTTGGAAPRNHHPPPAIITMTCGIRFTGRSSTFPGMTASLTRFPGLTVVSLTSGECRR
jgi:hypothetical protein